MSTPPIALVTERQYQKADPFFAAQSDIRFVAAPEDEGALAAAVDATGARLVIVGTQPYRGPLYERLAHTGQGRALIARFGVGHDSIDKARCRQLGITVTNTPGVLEVTVAEFTLALMASLVRQIPALDRAVKGGDFSTPLSPQLHGARLVVVGCGGIGRHVARGAHLGFGMQVTGVGRRPAAELARAAGQPHAAWLAAWGLTDYTTDADAALATADVVTLHLPPERRPWLDAARLARLRPTAFLVNTARGALIDERALFAALAQGQLAGAALDVFVHEPYRPVAPDADLRTLPNVICTPHAGSSTAATSQRLAAACVRNLRAFLAGDTAALNVVA